MRVSQEHACSMNENTPKSIAARAGAWSARNRRKAIFGWLAFVAIAFVLGGAAGQKTLTDEEQGTGESARAEKVLNDAFPEGPNEQVLIQARDTKDRTAAIRDVQQTLAQAKGITNIEKPEMSKDGVSAMIEFETVTDDEDK